VDEIRACSCNRFGRSSSRWRNFVLLVFVVLTVTSLALAEDPVPPKRDDAALAEFLRAVPAKAPADALKTFEMLDGFRIDLVAHEPMVTDPVAGAFDEDGRLYIAELNDYPYRQPAGSPPLGRIRLLEDTDGDGTFDRSHIFANELMWPTGVAVWKQGIFVAATPNIWYLKDTDGDHRADVRRKVFTGFGTAKAQGSVNNLNWGIDHQIYGAGSKNGGQVRGTQETSLVAVDRKDFRFDPESGRFEALSGGAQFGNSFDDWYNRFLCSQGHPVHHVVLPEKYLVRNPSLPVPRAVKNLYPEPTPIFRISPLESWRVIRSSRRITSGFRAAESLGVNHHVLDGAAGSTVYRGSAYPSEFQGSLFVGGAQTNLVHRMGLTPDGVTFQVSRADEDTEFLRSSDIWFRPVNFLNAPDGTLYVLDLYREYLEAVHIPYDVVKHLDLTSGRDRGRIYRVAPKDFQPTAPPKLSQASVNQLVATLENRSSWSRETAQRLIFERQDESAVPPLRKLLRKSGFPQARLHAMWSLYGLESLRDEDIARALNDEAPGIREHAVRLAESRMESTSRLFDKVLALADDPDPRVRFQVAFSLGEASDRRVIGGLARIARRDSQDIWIQTAILSSVPETSHLLLGQLLADRTSLDAVANSLLQKLAEVVGVRRKSEEVASLLRSAAALGESGEARQRLIVLGLGAGLARDGRRLDSMTESVTGPPQAMLQKLVQRATIMAQDDSASLGKRKQSIQLLGYLSTTTASRILPALLDSQQPTSVQSAAVLALAKLDRVDMTTLLLANWKSSTPAVRQDMLSALFSHPRWIPSLLDAIDEQTVLAGEIDASRRDLLLSHSDVAIRKRAGELFTAPGPRREVLEKYKDCLSLTGEPSRGKVVYEQVCVSNGT
jgi:putative membrane-bound dehydrogenase-like protein